MQQVAVSSQVPGSVTRSRFLTPVLIGLVCFQIWFMKVRYAARWRQALLAGGSGAHSTWVFFQVFALISVLFFLWRTLRVARYRPTDGLADLMLPEITVIVPAYNEGKQVYATLKSIAMSDYPPEKLHVITVDDGSADDTWQWMERAAGEFERMISAVRCRVNRGKRAALSEGFRRATGTVIVTIDSDSEVCRDTLRNLVSPFVVDPRVGAVAGNVRVLNLTGIIPRMLDVSFTFAFEFMRASESAVDTVTCCPGALSAFRRSIVDAVHEDWLHQSFLGRPALIGEDRAMTNLVLQRGYLVRFQSNAIVFTDVPRTTKQLYRMLLRWERSNVRETLALAGFVFTRFRDQGHVWGPRLDLLWAAAQMILQGISYPFLILVVFSNPFVLVWVTAGSLATALFSAAVFALSRGGTRGFWAFPWACFSPLCLGWITPYAMFTAHHSGWLTRQLPARPTFAPVQAATVEAKAA